MSFTFINKKCLILYSFLSILSGLRGICAQESAISNGIDAAIWQEEFLHSEDLEEQAYALQHTWEQLSDLALSPLNINTASADALGQIPFLNEDQIKALLDYRDRYGDLKTLSELKLIRGFNLKTRQLIAPLLCCEPSGKDNSPKRKLKQELIVHADRCLNQRAGYKDITVQRQNSNKVYLGSPWHESLRYKMKWGDAWDAGILLEKDAGEAYVTQFPYVNALHYYLQAKDLGRIRQIIVGDYRIRLGCGLLMNQNFGLNKSLSASQFMSQNTQFSPHAPADEHNYLQGAAACIGLSTHIQLRPFVSLRQLDGTMESDTLRSMKTDGVFNLKRDLDKRNACLLTTLGLNASYKGAWYEVGANILYQLWDHEYAPKLHSYNVNYFRGRQLPQASLEYRAMRYGIRLKGETAFSANGGWASILALQGNVGSAMHWLAVGRCMGKTYQQVWGNTLSESNDLQGEKGLFVQTNIELPHYLSLDLMGDYFAFSMPKYGIDHPASGYELSARLNYAPREALSVSSIYKLKIKQKNRPGSKLEPAPLIPYSRQAFETVASYQPLDWMLLKGKASVRSYSDTHKGTSMGYGLSPTLTLVPHKLPISFSATYTWFQTDNYDSRIYVSERNLLYGFSIPALYGKGQRLALWSQVKCGQRISAEAKVAWTNYRHQEQIGSGLQTIEGNNKWDLWLQLRCKL